MPDLTREPQPALIHVVASVVIVEHGKVLMIQEKIPKVYGKWNLPGGHVDEGETIEDAAIREAREEVGLDVTLTTALPVMHAAIDRPVLHPFAADITGGELHFDPDEILDAQWFTPAEIRAITSDLRAPDYLFATLDALGL